MVAPADNDPLAPPRDRELLLRFCRHHGIPAGVEQAGATEADAAPAAQAKLSVAASLPSSGGQRGVKQAGASEADAAPAGAACLAARGRTLVLTSLRARAHPLAARIMGNPQGKPAGIPAAEREWLLEKVAAAFARLPYENLSKVVSGHQGPFVSRSRRHPARVIDEHLRLGTGGTCFSLTAALLHLVRALGYRAAPLLADRHYGTDTHCALLVWLRGRPHLLDPGYLVTSPLPWPGTGNTRWQGPFNQIELRATGCGRVELHTGNGRQWRQRLTFHAGPASEHDFLRAWEASFDWPMMRRPVLTRVSGGCQLYLQGNRLLVRHRRGTRALQLEREHLGDEIIRLFGIDRRVVAPALELLRQRGQ
ncbi:MAG: hypothetical protein DRI34_01155 [Deltaproteobacteria bacterium]|nr:MAG: hypothetical protein DRI34_01155 [Deltaproteobacteria bacterium]